MRLFASFRLRWVASLLAGLIWLGLASPGFAVPLHVTSDDWHRIDKGEIVTVIGPDQNGIRLYQVMGLLDAPVDRVWKMLMDVDHYSAIFSAVSKSYIKKPLTPQRFQHFEELKLPWPLNSRWFVNIVTLHPEEHYYDWYNVEGNVKEQRGAFYCIPRGAKTMLCYQLYFDPNAPWFPKTLLNIGQQVTLPSVIKDTRKAVARY